MSKLLIVALAMLAYLLLLARSAWKQGQFRQFTISLAIVAGIAAVISGVIALALHFNGYWTTTIPCGILPVLPRAAFVDVPVEMRQ